MVRTLVLPEWRSRKVADITPTDIDRLLTKIAAGRPRVWKKTVKAIPATRASKAKQPKSKSLPKTFKPTPVRAKGVGEVLSKIFSLAVTWKIRTDNPATSFRKRPETARERFLSFEEIQRLADALCADPDQRAAGIIRRCMLTGARCGEARTATFDQFNLDLAIWTKQAAYTKQRRVHRVPILHEAVALIRLRGDAVPKGCPFLFPGDVPGQPLLDIKRFWERMRDTFASLLLSGGAPLEMIGLLLGRTEIETTERYVHLIDSPLRAGVNAVGEMLKPRLKIVAG